MTGHSLVEELTQRIFAPLGMQMSRYPVEDDLPYLHPSSKRFVVCMLNGTAGFRVATDAGSRELPVFLSS